MVSAKEETVAHKAGLIVGRSVKFAVVGVISLIHGFFYGIKNFAQEFQNGYQEGTRV